jgi:hypothetical protein
VTVPYSLARQERVNYLANGQIPFGEEAEPVTVTVEKADNPSKMGSVDIEVAKVQLDHFLIVVSPDSVAFAETATVKVQGKDKNEKDFEPPPETKVNMVLASDEKYGFLAYDGEIGKEIRAIPYSNARDGKVMFSATGENPIGLDPQSVIVGATKTGEERIAGSGRVVVRPTVEKLCQGDSRWASVRYDDYVKKKDGRVVYENGHVVYETVASKGCALTGLAMVARAGGVNVDPGVLAEYLRNNNGFSGVKVNWTAIDNLPTKSKYGNPRTIGNGLQFSEDGTKVLLDESVPLDLSKMDKFMQEGSLVLAQVYNPDTKNNHWVLLSGKRGSDYTIVDPDCYSGRTTLSGAYQNNVYKFVVFRKKI